MSCVLTKSPALKTIYCPDLKTIENGGRGAFIGAVINSVENSPVKEVGIITKVNFTLTDFKSEKLEHSKFTIL